MNNFPCFNPFLAFQNIEESQKNYEKLSNKIDRLEKNLHILENKINKLENTNSKIIKQDEPTDMYMI